MRKRISVNGQDIIEDIEQKIELLKYQYDLIIIDTFVEMKMNWKFQKKRNFPGFLKF